MTGHILGGAGAVVIDVEGVVDCVPQRIGLGDHLTVGVEAGALRPVLDNLLERVLLLIAVLGALLLTVRFVRQLIRCWRLMRT